MQNTLFDRIGGAESLLKLVTRFYELMDQLDQASDIRQQHASDLTNAANKLYMFLSGWLGGPSLYIEKYGHPKLRQRHLPFSIGEKERDQWMLCMYQAMDDTGLDSDLKAELGAAFYKTADFMRNQ
ncbi:MAG: group II truncated hemoglobin [Gammaproteobacteria bacterium]|nr:group II truncated hemoglobin [Gammaproteobacteria bacterium]